MKAYRLVHAFELAKNPPFKPNPNRFGRWAHDYPVAYASEHLALAALETLGYWAIHADLNWYSIFAYSLEKGDSESALETDPQLNIKDKIATQRFGDEWIRKQRTLALAVPSVRLPYSINILINANHPDFNPAKIEHLGELHWDEPISRLIETAKTHRH